MEYQILLMNKDSPYPNGACVQINPALYVSCAEPLMKPPPTHVAEIRYKQDDKVIHMLVTFTY